MLITTSSLDINASSPKITPGSPEPSPSVAGGNPRPAWNAASSPTRIDFTETRTAVSASPRVTTRRSTPAPSTRSNRSGLPPAPITITPLSASAASLPLPNASINPPKGFDDLPFSTDPPSVPAAPDPTAMPAAAAAALLTMVCGAPVSNSAGIFTPFSVTFTASRPHGSSSKSAVTSPSSAPASQSYSW